MSFLFALISSVGTFFQITQGVPYAVVKYSDGRHSCSSFWVAKASGALRDGIPALIAGVVASSIMSGTSLLYATLGEIVGERRRHRQSGPSKASC